MRTKNYMPPQIFLDNKRFNPIKADIFSLGVKIFTLSAGVKGIWFGERLRLLLLTYKEKYSRISQRLLESVKRK